ncbi:MAG: hypothetical protein C0525_05175 [Flavobacterium sp.]|nr:hypothetical protein [Flavobacterium sp.]
MGDNLVKNGCLCFIGYNRVISIWSTYLNPFVVCANHGLKLFYNGINTSQILTEMKNQYNMEIDSVYPKNYLISSILRENRDALILHGENIDIGNL